MLSTVSGLILLIIGIALSRYAWVKQSKINEIEDEQEWEEAVYGADGEVGVFGMVIGSGFIFTGILFLLHVL